VCPPKLATRVDKSNHIVILLLNWRRIARCAIRELSVRCGKRTVQVGAPGLRMGKAMHGRNVIWKRSSQ
jgi:hypothetical protein